MMRRIKDYLRFAVWQSGLGYIALWAVAYWALDWGPAVFGGAEACHVDNAKVMFYWECDDGGVLGFLASVADTALTVTVWAPVYVAAATVRPEAMAIAVPIVAAHVIGLPLAILVTTRLALRFFARVKRALLSIAGRAPAAAGSAELAQDSETSDQPVSRRQPLPYVAPRQTFGLRGTSR
jgi:hypothetical protein